MFSSRHQQCGTQLRRPQHITGKTITTKEEEEEEDAADEEGEEEGEGEEGEEEKTPSHTHTHHISKPTTETGNSIHPRKNMCTNRNHHQPKEDTKHLDIGNKN